MKVIVLFLLVALILVIWFLFCGRRRENFFNDLSVDISWTPPVVPDPSNISYRWKICTGATCASTPPSSWPYPTNTTSATSVVLTSANCPGCDFGEFVYFAVMSTDTSTGLFSPWTTVTMSLNPTLSGTAVITGPSGVPIAPGQVSFNYALTLQYPGGPPPSIANQDLETTLTRGTSVFTMTQPLASSNPVVGNTVHYTAVGSLQSSAWEPSTPQSLEAGDVLKFTALIAESTVSPNPVIFYGTQTVSVTAPAPVAPGSPTGITWNIS